MSNFTIISWSTPAYQSAPIPNRSTYYSVVLFLSTFSCYLQTDGAAACMLMTEERAKAMGLKPKVFIRDFIYVAQNPISLPLSGGVFAIPAILERCNLTMNDIDVWEVLEDYAVSIEIFYTSTDDQFKSLSCAKSNLISLGASGWQFQSYGLRLVRPQIHEPIRKSRSAPFGKTKYMGWFPCHGSSYWSDRYSTKQLYTLIEQPWTLNIWRRCSSINACCQPTDCRRQTVGLYNGMRYGWTGKLFLRETCIGFP